MHASPHIRDCRSRKDFRSATTVMCPNSAAIPRKPRITFPFEMMPPPMPVPSVSRTRSFDVAAGADPFFAQRRGVGIVFENDLGPQHAGSSRPEWENPQATQDCWNCGSRPSSSRMKPGTATPMPASFVAPQRSRKAAIASTMSRIIASPACRIRGLARYAVEHLAVVRDQPRPSDSFHRDRDRC